MPRRPQGQDLSALERAILGVLHTSGPCTAYAVRQEFVRSPSSQWSGSSGAVYPALARLRRLGLVEAAGLPGGGRGAQDLRLTPAGVARLRAWLRSPVTGMEAAHVFDPIRLRVFFFDTLTPPQRLTVVADAIARLEATLGNAEAQDRERLPPGDRFTAWASAGARRQIADRLAWFRELRVLLEQDPAAGAPTRRRRRATGGLGRGRPEARSIPEPPG